MESSYLIRTDGPNKWLISKWGRGDIPEAVYSVWFTQLGYKCNCQSRSSVECKHVKMLKEQIKLKNPNVI